MDQDPIDIKATILQLRRQSKLILSVILLCLAIAVGYIALVKPIYTATALVMVDPAAKSLVYSDDTSQSASTENARVESEVEIFRSPTVALAVVDRMNLISDPEFGPTLGLGAKIGQALGFRSDTAESGTRLLNQVLARFQKAVTVRRRGLTYLIAVSVSSEDAERAAALTNAMTEAYIQANIESKVASRLNARDALQDQIATVQAAMTASEDAIDNYISRNLGRLEAEGGGAAVAELQRQIEALDKQRLAAEVSAREARKALEQQDWATLTARLGDEALAELQAQRDKLERQLAGTDGGSSDEVDLRSALAALDARQARAAEEALSALTDKAGALDQTMRETRDKLRRTLLSSDLPSQMLSEIYQLQQEASIARSQYQTLLSRLREIEVQAAVQVADSRVVSAALPPVSASYPNRKLVLALALLAGLGLGTGLAFLNEFYLGGIVSETQLRDVLKQKVATAIPLVALKPESERSIADNVITSPLSAYSEAIRRLRASIELELRQRPVEPDAEGRKPGRTIVVTSSGPAEGKSTTALALARAFSLSQVSVLLIDADLRKPTIHQLAGITPERGLIDYLTDASGSTPAEKLLTQDPISATSLITGRGRAFQETDQLLGSDTFRGLIRAGREAFDIVILDTPPVGPVVDARYLVPYGDVVALVVRFATFSQSDLRSATQTLTENMGPDQALLTVLNHEPETRRRYPYYKDDYAG
ncbi:GumC family protein [Frigidibacter sp. ROC022]|uniref:GumC family protein n=1 Tax=Frigidibacter sp. ROC022 TaxID=2971796 RepID=UPI00215A63BE|nr:Wzz/FepE/Etk N-terminal domain-containing protein [Frigidibacter sp. ROC022]MCR8723852.1 Wzz/FepE/Etk N-terminal domain-containing protein [Frigidibacter sp. ROC022]